MSTVTETGTGIAWERSVSDAPVCVHAAGDLVAVAGAAGEGSVLDAETGERVGEFELPGGLLRIAVSPDGQHVAAAGPTGYVLWRRSDGRVREVSTGAWSAAVAWAGENRLAVAAGRRALVLDADGAELWATEPAASTVTDVAWLRQGRRLAVAAYGAVNGHERHTAKPVVSYPYVGSHLALAVAPTGKWICSGNQDASIHIWRTRDGSELTMSGYPEKVSRLAFDDTGFWMASDGAADITVWDFSGRGPAGTQPRQLRAHQKVTALAWRPGSGTQLASGGEDGTVALWHATAGRPGALLQPTRTFELGSAVVDLAWPDPEMLVAAGRDGLVRAQVVPDRTRL
ncbi:hypothetical protein G5C60_45000 [Streptomyces sp. HC44]|uniref:Uncharacterized protein n=1 Tax=Streptomyces scabichelini TaxID=2711217 RepID=A0A6G4VK68_9ACTN|nr:hypothetical protein [Streptomyces scabichelini]NGO14568.1 hypothetical protein [Streptomyces scabichelini]